MTEIDNPYWVAIEQRIRAKLLAKDEKTKTLQPAPGQRIVLNELRVRHSRTIPDPELVEWVAKMCGSTVVEVDAGSACWSGLLHQHGLSVTAYDLNPVARSHYPTDRMDRWRRALAPHSNATMICMNSAEPYDSLVRALGVFAGPQLMFSADSDPTRAKALNAILTREWDYVTKTFGYCRLDELREVYVFKKRRIGRAAVPGWNDTPTQFMPVVVVDV